MPGTILSAQKEIRARWYLQVEKYGKSVKEVCNILALAEKHITNGTI